MDVSKLTERLRAVVRLKPDATTAVASGFSRTSPDSSPSLEQILGGAWQSEKSGRSFVVERRVRADAFHGDVRIDDSAGSLERSTTRASLLMRNVPARPPCLFFDLETTGLSGGAGTYAFLVGCGEFEADGGFVTRQYLLSDIRDERAMLEAVAAEFERAGVLVSFNGKSFDAPLLETRHLYHRLGWAAGSTPHLDVLHPARRFWGGGGPDAGCSLVALEQRLVGATREDDVPGLEIPGRYFQFMRCGDARPLAGILEHNRLDLLSLAVLTARLLRLVEEGAGGTEQAQEALALGQVYADSGLESRARDAYRRAVLLSAEPQLRISSLRALAIAERRARAFDAAAQCWQRLLDSPDCPRRVAGEAAEALAIHHEHRRRDLEKARVFAVKSLGHQTRPSGTDAVQHRLARLDKKIGSASEPSLFPFSTLQPSCGSPTSGHRTSS